MLKMKLVIHKSNRIDESNIVDEPVLFSIGENAAAFDWF